LILSSFKIISNTSQCQAVQLNKETYLLALYEAGSVPLSGELKFESNKKGLFILRTYKKKWKVYASDPTQTETSMEVILNGNKREIKLPEGEYERKRLQCFVTATFFHSTFSLILFSRHLHLINIFFIYASDPTQTETSMEVILNGNKREIKLPEGEYKGTAAMFSE